MKTIKDPEKIKKGNRANDFLKKHHSIFFNLKTLQIYEKKQPFWGSWFIIL